MVLRTLIIDPDSKERLKLREILKKIGQIEVVGEAPSIKEALQLIHFVPYDLLLLYTDLEDESLSSLIKKLKRINTPPMVIALADGGKISPAAYELDAIDFISKPIDEEKLTKAIEKAKHLRPAPYTIKRKSTTTVISIPSNAFDEVQLFEAIERSWREGRPPPFQKLPIEKSGKHILIPFSEIIFAEAWGDYTYIYTAEEKIFTSYSLKKLEERFKDSGFFRVHRKYLVNLNQVIEIATMPGQSCYLRTKGKHKMEIPVSRRRLKQLKNILGL